MKPGKVGASCTSCGKFDCIEPFCELIPKMALDEFLAQWVIEMGGEVFDGGKHNLDLNSVDKQHAVHVLFGLLSGLPIDEARWLSMQIFQRRSVQ